MTAARVAGPHARGEVGLAQLHKTETAAPHVDDVLAALLEERDVVRLEPEIEGGCLFGRGKEIAFVL